MHDEKLKLLLSVLVAVVFSLILIITAFIVPIKKEKVDFSKAKKPKNALEKVSHGIKN